MSDRREYFSTYNKQRYANDPEYRRACLECAARHWRQRKAAETPEQRRERITRDKVRRALRENARDEAGATPLPKREREAT